MKKYIGLDLGTVTLGIAKSDALGFVHQVETFRFPKTQYVLARKRVYELCEELEITDLVLGLPKHLNNTDSEMSKTVERFRDDLIREHPELTVELVDERLSSVSANNFISLSGMNHQQRKNNVDAIAASIILDTYLRMKGVN